MLPTRSSSARPLALLPLLAALGACGADPAPREEPPPAAAAPAPRTGTRPTAAPPAREGGPQAGAAPAGPGTSKIRTVPKEVLELQEGDLVEVSLARGGAMSGTVRALRPRLLTLVTGEGKGNNLLITQYRPADVRDVRLVRRPTRDLLAPQDRPLDPSETWLPEHADGEILGHDAAGLWSGRFADNMPLLVAREFRLDALSFVERAPGRATFSEEARPTVLQRDDQIKLVGAAMGFRQVAGKDAPPLGEVYLYLVRRGKDVWCLPSLERLHLADLDPRSVQRFLASEQVTLVIRRPATGELVRVSRIAAKMARQYRDHIERTPDRPAMRRMRAKSDPGLAEAEQRVRTLFRAIGEEDMSRSLRVTFTLPAAEEGSIHLLPYVKEIGLD